MKKVFLTLFERFFFLRRALNVSKCYSIERQVPGAEEPGGEDSVVVRLKKRAAPFRQPGLLLKEYLCSSQQKQQKGKDQQNDQIDIGSKAFQPVQSWLLLQKG